MMASRRLSHVSKLKRTTVFAVWITKRGDTSLN
jgi:hypothetical protein